MNKKLTQTGKNIFKNTMRMVNFSNRLKEERSMWRKYDRIKKRKLEESDQESNDEIGYENKYFRDDSMRSLNDSNQKMDISIHDSNNLSNLRHLNESNIKLKKLKTPNKSPNKDRSYSINRKEKPSSSFSKYDRSSSKKKNEIIVLSSDSESSSDEEEDDKIHECMIDNSFNSSIDDNKLLKTPKSTKTAYEKKIKLREKLFKKQLDKQKKKEKKDKKKKKKSKKNKD